MIRKTLKVGILAAVAGSAALGAFASDPMVHSKYAGEQTRAIKSLSSEDIAELRRGGGWGLAKAAELNGLPGPAHLLELKDRIPLTAPQVTAVETLYLDMKARAIAEGEKLITLERELDRSVKDGRITDSSLRDVLRRIAVSREKLRYIHLSTHLKTPKILSQTQIARYNRLRGYADDPCANVPDGHDPAMWRRHNQCR